jgi:hypothetical protein
MLSPKPPLVEAPGGSKSKKEKAYAENNRPSQLGGVDADCQRLGTGGGKRRTAATVLSPWRHLPKVKRFVSVSSRYKLTAHR